MKLLCKLFGHRWNYVGNFMNCCSWCRKYGTDAERFGKADRFGN